MLLLLLLLLLLFLFFLLIPSGINIYCLQLWGDASGPFVNALYLFQGAGFLLSPIMTECVLAPTSFDTANNSTDLLKFNITQILEATNFSSAILNEAIEVQQSNFTPVQVKFNNKKIIRNNTRLGQFILRCCYVGPLSVRVFVGSVRLRGIFARRGLRP